MMPPAIPMTSAATGPTKPEAGVMDARPATAPVTAPTMLGLPNFSPSMTIQTTAAVAAEIWVTVMAMPASPPALSALPALKPNHPTHSMQAPAMVIHGACGGFTSSGKPHALPEQHGEDKCRNSGSQVHHKAAGKIENAPLRKPAPASHPMGDRHVDEKKPKEGEQKHSAKAHALHKSADDERGRDNGEGHLEHEEHGPGEARVRGGGIARHAEQQRLLQIANPGDRAAEGQAIAAKKPNYRDEAGYGEALHQHGEQVLGADQPSIEQGQPRQSHEQNQGSRSYQPSGVPRVDHGVSPCTKLWLWRKPYHVPRR